MATSNRKNCLLNVKLIDKMTLEAGALKMEEPGTQKAALPWKEKFREFTKFPKMTEENVSPLVYLTPFRPHPKSGCLLQIF